MAVTTKKVSWYKKYASYKYYVPLANAIAPYCLWLSLILGIVGLTLGLGFAPADYQQGNSFRIIYIHVPAAMLSTALYITMAVMSLCFLIWRVKLLTLVVRSIAVVGATCTLIALVTGAIWGAPTWGTWWVWDIRLTSELLLLFFYIGYIAFDHAIEDRQTADIFTSILAVIGIAVAILVKVSVFFFNSLHQKSTVFASGGPSIQMEMFLPLILMILAYGLFTSGYVLKKSVNLIYKEKLMKHYLNQ
ncbi:heme ABC transporter permease CcmC [Wohlfahrtiimonas chitiniclastica]|uniref:Heme exporter protein C n=2 Tax=Wohlfahrtiimonas chitiniclastica TaxID=400946 RepID=L8XVZ5_9GAMM|nr:MULTISPECIES: heme ABC transporter permease CcmC [Wohlfahrtiimonas]ELV08223.1 Heme exporter protein C [Wohlfahrtiimonas chitiniclastica SH04]KZS23152.1 Heme exporter protein C [Wohlfahrtiimonas chitiniclastica]KZX37499.1 heme transporter HemC [Wohlfahrtiimonas chitiniclastica]MBS7814319.1 cytochrome c biogenesis protein CcsA [Wohlfahrtiimonas chitiniclastica]MBS7816860.1 cytochrome c biogenesis protein CcsA [Wohlfahrtiimonas chitiniclastica]